MVDLSSAPTDHFFKIAKTLLKRHTAGDPSALARAASVFGDLAKGSGGFSLMRAQHVVAVEHGFENWTALHAAPPADQRAAIGKRRAEKTLHAAKPIAVSSNPAEVDRVLRPLLDRLTPTLVGTRRAVEGKVGFLTKEDARALSIRFMGSHLVEQALESARAPSSDAVARQLREGAFGDFIPIVVVADQHIGLFAVEPRAFA